MKTDDIAEQSPKRTLRGATVQYKDGRTVRPAPLDIDQILADMESSDEEERSAFLCALGHNLTVEIRVLLFDRPVSEVDLDRAYQINESLHQLTSCIHPRYRRSAAGDAQLVRDIIDSSYLYGLEGAVGRALATVAGNLSSLSSNTTTTAKYSTSSDDDLPAYPDVEGELLLFIFRSGGDKFSRKAEEVYAPLADIFGLSHEQRARLRADREESLWNNRVQCARRKLVDAGLMFKGPRGVWRLTENGRRRAEALKRR
jgi:Mrr N-terminal domain